MTAIESARTALVIADVELRHALQRATSEHVNALAPDLPPIVWTRRTAHDLAPYLVGQVPLSFHDGAQAPAVAQQWAERLGLAEVGCSHEGGREWAGDALLYTGGKQCNVRVWCVADEAAWDAAEAARDAAEGR
ncbi:hypothetical protein NONO_c18120 [Nocardia nova SH22a]|uniref:Uncharacterized protein n=1 Tax=Nocardia nova SH22a TaxID=1415166 RepID=W5TBL7_9NOCA|nr:hypothetical protein [Nocardia nova]AHH16612.1 hypothetical protein NONO_c18120 [Nocardia nova SH22a]